ncbi:MSF1-domain-containing protein [Heliocybe sulcata]|uniref:MSF1-domain-containing protein n=1 Tax=Heliocybe sulcata TaxID=5364 RepID=A0A5C3NI78_9AGAM|nr:MSF1-domain-containing protein [Heliocybe sulcata]
MRFFSQSFSYDEPWSIVSLAYFLRYPNPHAAHIVSCDVVDRTITSSGTLVTTRLILKKGTLPRWAPEGIIPRSEAWVIEESEVNPYGQVLRCTSRNLDHVKILSARESVLLHSAPNGQTLQRTDVNVVSNFGWGLTQRIEQFGFQRFKSNVQKSREGLKLIVELTRQSRQGMTMGGAPPGGFNASEPPKEYHRDSDAHSSRSDAPSQGLASSIWNRVPWPRFRST